MKKLFAGVALMGIAVFASAQTISFDTTTLDYGTIKKGSDGNRKFIVKNTGDKPLIISSVKPGCGCTTPKFSQEPILPGKTGEIAVHYDTNNPQPFQKIIEVFSNDPQNSRTVINIKGVVQDNAATATTQVQAVQMQPAMKAEKAAPSATASKKQMTAKKATAKAK